VRKFLALCLLALPLVAKDDDVAQRLSNAATMFSEIMDAPDKTIPRDLLDRAECVVLVPSLKSGGFIAGVKYGKGFILCRKSGGTGWSAPGAVRIEGGSFGLQIGASETDVVMLVMNDEGRKAVLSSQYTMGGHAEVAAGPVGRSSSAQTSGWMSAGILSYSRARGIFAGLSLQGSTLRQDLDDNEAMYGKKLENQEIVSSRTLRPPKSAQKLLAELRRYSPREKKS
jgi:lipid-binding SYLF domain-containing protein